jgi:transcriptional pleiotropic regulator of transition state genes
MKNTGIVRKVDQLGRIVLPMELRRVLDIKETDPLEIYTEDDTIILKKYTPDCILCGDNDNHLVNFKGKMICKSCLKDLKNQNK